MKKIIYILFLYFLLTLITFNVNAQVPYGINYQAVARNAEGYPISNTEIVLEISILKGTGNEIVWQETHIGTTDKFGLLNVVIGKGSSTLVGTVLIFKDINWTADKYFVKVRADFGDENFVNGMVDLGITPLQSVPYALVAARAEEAPNPNLSDVVNVNESALNLNDGIAWNGTAWQAGSFFLSKDGSTDLTGDWTISTNNISLTSGTLLTNALKTNSGATINNFSTDILLGSGSTSDASVSTQKAVKTYVDVTRTGLITYVDNKFATTWISAGDNLYNETKKIGIGTDTPLDKFHADLGTEGFLVTGTYSSGETVITKTGSIMFYSPAKAAFRAGFDELGVWQDGKLGLYSAAFGKSTEASGAYSFSFGLENVASGSQSFAGGVYNTATGANTVVFGQNNSADGRSSFVIGEHLIAESYLETVFGRYNRKKTSFQAVDGINYQNSDLLFVIGNGTGTANSERKNAFTIVKNGNVGIKTTLDPTSTLQVEGSVASTIQTVNSNTTLTVDNNVVLVDASGGNVDITLPVVVDGTDYLCLGREYTIKKIDGTLNNVNVVGTATATIDGQSSISLSEQWYFVKIINDGNQWYIIGTN